MRGYVFQLHFVGGENEVKGVNMGRVAENGQIALAEIMELYKNTTLQGPIQVSSSIVFPLYDAEITAHSYQSPWKESFRAKAAIGGGYLFYVRQDGTKFFERCAIEHMTNYIWCKIYKNDHEIRFCKEPEPDDKELEAELDKLFLEMVRDSRDALD